MSVTTPAVRRFAPAQRPMNVGEQWISSQKKQLLRSKDVPLKRRAVAPAPLFALRVSGVSICSTHSLIAGEATEKRRKRNAGEKQKKEETKDRRAE